MTGSRKLSRWRIGLLATAMVLSTLLPVVVLRIAGAEPALTAAVLGGLTALVAGLLIGGRFSIEVTVALTVAQFMAYLSTERAIGAGVVMGVVALGYGLVARRGATAAIVTAPIAILLTLTSPPQAIADHPAVVTALVVALGALVGGLWGTAVGCIASRRITRPTLGDLSRLEAWIYASTIAIVSGVLMAIVVTFDLQKGGEWFVLTLFIVVQPSLHRTWDKTMERIVGTTIGFVIVAVIGVIDVSRTTLTVLAVVFLIAAVVVKIAPRPYWQYVVMLTPAVVLAEGASTDIWRLDVVRLQYTLLGSLVAIVVLAIFHGFAVRLTPVGQSGSG